MRVNVLSLSVVHHPPIFSTFGLGWPPPCTVHSHNIRALTAATAATSIAQFHNDCHYMFPRLTLEPLYMDGRTDGRTLSPCSSSSSSSPLLHSSIVYCSTYMYRSLQQRFSSSSSSNFDFRHNFKTHAMSLLDYICRRPAAIESELWRTGLAVAPSNKRTHEQDVGAAQKESWLKTVLCLAAYHACIRAHHHHPVKENRAIKRIYF